MQSTRAAWLIPTVTALVAFSVYLLTLMPEVGAGDAAELSLQAYQLGVTHPPGYPVHTFMARLVMLIVSDPARATNLLSAGCTAVAVGLLCGMALTLTRDWRASVLAALVFGLMPTVWQAAVNTEVYNVNICLVAAALALSLSWRRQSSRSAAGAAGAVFGLSFGSSLANALLLPGFTVLVWRGSRGKLRDVILWFAAVAVAAVVVLSWTYFRSKAVLPLGTTYVPDTAGGLLRYLRGDQYTVIEALPAGFYVQRIVEHGLYWGTSLLWLGLPLGIYGIVARWRRDRLLGIALLTVFLLNLGYFTFHTWSDYRDMVTPAYFVFALWIAFGIQAWRKLPPGGIPRSTAAVVGSAIVIGLLVSGLRDHEEARRGTPVTDFVRASFETFEPRTTVVTAWSRFTPMLYFQRVHGLRPDLRIVERAEAPRRYDWGTVADWRQFVYETTTSRPVMCDTVDEVLRRRCAFTARGGWYGVTAPSAPRP